MAKKRRNFLVDALTRMAMGTWSLMRGMRITLRYLFSPKSVITQQYPENRAELRFSDRFRSRLAMVHDEEGHHKCTVCGLCEEVCPNGSIKLVERDNPPSGKTELDAFLWRLDSCTFCNACVIVCPFSVLTMDGQFESAVYDRRLFVYNLSQYAGAPAKLLKKVEDPVERQKMIEPRGAYCGDIPLRGHAWDGLRALNVELPRPNKASGADVVDDLEAGDNGGDKPRN